MPFPTSALEPVAVVKVPGPEAGMSDSDGSVDGRPEVPPDGPPEVFPDGPPVLLPDAPVDGPPEVRAVPEPPCGPAVACPEDVGADSPAPPDSADAVGRPWADVPPEPADAQPAAATPAAPRTASATVPPHTAPFRSRRPEACARPCRRRPVGDAVALCAVMVV